LFGIYSAFYVPYILQLLFTPAKLILDSLNYQADLDSVWFKVVLFQCRLQGIFACGLVLLVLFFVMHIENTKLQTNAIGVLALLQVGVLYILTTLQFSEGLMRPWHTNVRPHHLPTNQQLQQHSAIDSFSFGA
jgi:amino acid transporter